MYDEIIRPFLDRLAETGRKETTIKVNYYHLNTCLRILGDAGRHTHPLEIDRGDLQFLKETLIATRTGEATAKAMVKGLDNLIVFYGGESVLRGAQMLWNRTIRDRVFITAEEASRLYDAADPTTRLVIVLGSMMGLRRQEMATIRLDEVRRTDIVVHGKGHGGAGLVTPQPMPDAVRREIDAYLPWRNAHAPADNDRLVVYTSAKLGVPVRQSKVPDEISARMKALGDSLGIRATAHSLRRLYATTVYEVSGHDAATTKSLMRHASVMTTIDCYIAPNALKQKDAVEAVGAALRF